MVLVFFSLYPPKIADFIFIFFVCKSMLTILFINKTVQSCKSKFPAAKETKDCAIVGDIFFFTAQELHSDLALDGMEN